MKMGREASSSCDSKQSTPSFDSKQSKPSISLKGVDCFETHNGNVFFSPKFQHHRRFRSWSSNYMTHIKTVHRPRGACAVCRHRHRRCDPDFPYFLSRNPQQFLNAHRLQSVNDILRAIHATDPLQRMLAVRSIIHESNQRPQEDRDLEGMLNRKRDELELVERRLALCRLEIRTYDFAGPGVNMDPGLLNSYVPMSQWIMPTPGLSPNIGSSSARPEYSNALQINEDQVILDLMEEECDSNRDASLFNLKTGYDSSDESTE